MRQTLRQIVAVLALAGLAMSLVPNALAASYTDLSAANKLATAGVIVDKSATPAAYRLGDTLLRQEGVGVAAKALGILEGQEGYVCKNKFSDISEAWVCRAAELAAKAGLTNGANSTFRPKDNLTKYEAMLFALRSSCTVPTDKSVSGVAAYAAEAGIITTAASFNGTAAATRGEFFRYVATAMEDSACGDTTDEDVICTLFPALCEEDPVDPTPTGGDVEVSLSADSPEDGDIAIATPRTTVLAFDVTAGDTDVVLKDATLEFVGTGDEDEMGEMAIYLGNRKVTKQTGKTFNNDLEAVVTFEAGTKVEAGETVTFMVTTTVTTVDADQVQVALTELSTTADTVDGLPVKGAKLDAIEVKNKGAVEINGNKATETVTVGKTVKLAGFELESTNNKEDVIVKSVAFTVTGSVDMDDLADLVLFADGKEIAADLSVNSDDEIIADLDYTIEADDKIKFELRGMATGSINETIGFVFDDADDIYVVGAETELSLSVSQDTPVVLGQDITDEELATVHTSREIEGSEISVSFDKSTIDEAKPNSEGILVGTLKLTATGNYTVDELQVTVGSDTENVEDIVNTLELDGATYDAVTGGNSTTAVYKFQDIVLTAGETVSLPVTLDVVDEPTLTGETLTFTPKINEVTDEDNDENYTLASVPAVGTILSSNSFNNKTIDIESATFTLTRTTVTDKAVVLGNGVEVVLYKGKLSVGDADGLTINDFNFAPTGTTLAGGVTFDDVVDSAVLNIGGKTYSADVETTGLEFTNINHMLAAGVDNVEVTVTATLQDDDAVVNGNFLKVVTTAGDLDLEDSDGEDLVGGNAVVNAGTVNKVTLNDSGALTVTVISDGDYKDSVKSDVLAGTNGVAIAEVKLEAENEDVKVKEMVFKVDTVDLSTTLKNVRLVNAATNAVIADGATITYSTGATETLITFKDDFTMLDSSNEVKALLVADLEIITDKGGAVSAVAGALTVTYAGANTDATGVSSNEDVTVNGASVATVYSAETVSVVPALVTASIVSSLGTDDSKAELKFTVDRGSNDLTNSDVLISSINLEGVLLESAVTSPVTATRTVTVAAAPANAETMTIGSCVVTFTTTAGSTVDDTDCTGGAVIDTNTGAGNVARSAADVSAVIDTLTNVTDPVQGALTVGAGAASTTVFTAGAALTGSIVFTDGTTGDVTATNTAGVTAVAAVAALDNIRNDDNVTVTVTDLATDPLAITAGNKIVTLDVWTFNVKDTTVSKELRIDDIVYSVGGTGAYSISNEKVVDLGKYVDSN